MLPIDAPQIDAKDVPCITTRLAACPERQKFLDMKVYPQDNTIVYRVVYMEGGVKCEGTSYSFSEALTDYNLR